MVFDKGIYTVCIIVILLNIPQKAGLNKEGGDSEFITLRREGAKLLFDNFSSSFAFFASMIKVKQISKDFFFFEEIFCIEVF